MTEIANQNIDIEVVETGGETAQYFWHNTTDSGAGEGAGAHITEIPKEDFIDDPDAGGTNTLINTNGMAVRDGLTELGVFSAEQIRLGDLDGGNIVIVPTGFNINNAGVQLAAFDVEDGIMFKTQEGADALSVVSGTTVVTRTIKEATGRSYYSVIPYNKILPQGTSVFDTIIGTSYPIDRTLTVHASNIYEVPMPVTYSDYTITHSNQEDRSVRIGTYTYSNTITINVYIVWLITGELILRREVINSGVEENIGRAVRIKIPYVSYEKNVYVPKIITEGDLYLYGHSTPVGDIMSLTTNDYSVTYSSGSASWVYPQGDDEYAEENGLLLPAGRWIIQASIRLQTLTDGAQYGVGVGYGDSRTNATIILPTRQVITAGSTSALILNTTHLVDASGSNRYYVGVYHGSKATVTYMSIRAMRVR